MSREERNRIIIYLATHTLKSYDYYLQLTDDELLDAYRECKWMNNHAGELSWN